MSLNYFITLSAIVPPERIRGWDWWTEEKPTLFNWLK